MCRRPFPCLTPAGAAAEIEELAETKPANIGAAQRGVAAVADIVVQVDKVTIEAGGAVLLDGISFDVRRGEAFIILGPSGCGKSTLLKHMIGLRKPVKGDIRISGRSIVHDAAAARAAAVNTFGVLYQSGALFGSMSVLENVCLPLLEHTRLPPELIAALAREKLAAVGLADVDDHLPGELSGGMRKRAALARALVMDPPLLFLDEPSAGLDPVGSAELDRLILDLRDRYGTTMVIVSHELDSIFTVADQAIILRDRRIGAIGTVQQLLARGGDPWITGFLTRAGTREQPNAASGGGKATG